MDPSFERFSSDELTGNLVSILRPWLLQDQFKDFTLACPGGGMGAHKIILISRSSFFRNLFQTSQQPFHYFEDLTLKTLQSIVDFIYLGQVAVEKESVEEFIECSQYLGIKEFINLSTKQGNTNEDHGFGKSENILLDSASCSEQNEVGSSDELQKEALNEKTLILNSSRNIFRTEDEGTLTENQENCDIVERDERGQESLDSQNESESILLDPASNYEQIEDESPDELQKESMNENRLLESSENLLHAEDETSTENQENSDMVGRDEMGQESLDNQKDVLTQRETILPMDEEKYSSMETRVYTCDLCDFDTTHRRKFYHHKRIVHENQEFYCDQCGYVCKSSVNLKHHQESKHEMIRYPCDQCKYQALSTYTLKTHIRDMHERIPQPCNKCDFVAETLAILKNHNQSKHEQNIYTCGECGYHTKLKSYLRAHTREKHSNKLHFCTICGYTTKTSSSLYRHKNSKHDGKKFPCKVEKCGYVATQKFHLDSHHRSQHEGIRYHCDVENCAYVSTQKTNLNFHKSQKHENSPAHFFYCKTCDIVFTAKRSLKRHKERVRC